ncbi:MAG: hypothetical protein HYX87_09285 [Chloroflexi bacterium]|nr:hypothetical protein [Chloroflexota bacterium]
MAKRRDSWLLGIQHREALLGEYMIRTGMRERPLLKDVVDDLLTEIQGVRLREEVLPLDTYAQSEMVDGRIEVSINKRIGAMPGVKDAAGIAHVAKWHESIHGERDMRHNVKVSSNNQLAFPDIGADTPRLIVCRRTGTGEYEKGNEREFIAETAALAAAIAPVDLARSGAFAEFQALAVRGGDVTTPGWSLLYDTAAFIGVNISALVKFLAYRGVIQIVKEGGKSRIIATKPLLLRDAN